MKSEVRIKKQPYIIMYVTQFYNTLNVRMFKDFFK